MKYLSTTITKPDRAALFRHWIVLFLILFALLSSMIGVPRTSHAAEVVAGREKIIALQAGADNTLLKATSKGLYRIRAGGNWESIALPSTPASGTAALAAPTGQPEVMYIAGPGIGVQRSADGGRHWTPRNEGLDGSKVTALTTHATQANTVFAYVNGIGIFRSQDAGAHWKKMDHGPRERIVGFIHSNMAGSMQTGWLFATTAKGVRRSMDCFCGWQSAGGLKGSVQAVSYDPKEPRRVYAATGDSLFVSTDGGEQWARTASPAAVLSALSVTPSGAVYAASGAQIFRSEDHGKTWKPVDA